MPAAGGLLPPVFFETALRGDLLSVGRQAGARNFDSSLVRGVSRRCRFGFPQVTVCDPVRKGRPFPTVFWLSCPWLSQMIDELESRGHVRSLGEYISKCKRDEWAVFNLEYLLFRVFLLGYARAERIRRERIFLWKALTSTGAGGIRSGGDISVKCLHLQTASMIGLGWHPGEDWLAGHLPELECSDPEDWPCREQRNSAR